MHDSGADGQADTAARILDASVQPLENTEDMLRVCWIEPDPVIANREEPVGAATPRGDPDDAFPVQAPVFERISQQVLPELQKMGGTNADRGQRFTHNFSACFLYQDSEVLDCLLQHRTRFDDAYRLRAGVVHVAERAPPDRLRPH
jgi:hypothetical protein